jgi:uncharacterized protein (TIGR03437 family)
MHNQRVFSAFVLMAALASTASAQCYQFSGSGATLQITISSFISKTTTPSNGTGYVTNDYFQGNNSFTVGGVTQTSISTTNTPTCENCLIGAVIFNYQPGPGSVTAFTMTVPATGTPASQNSWMVVLGGTGNVIPGGLLPSPAAFPPISSWVLPANENNIVVSTTVNGVASFTDYPITSIGPCSGAAGGPPATPSISGVVSASAFGGFPIVAPGSWVEIYGANLAPDTREWGTADFSGPNGEDAPTTLDGVVVTIGGQNAFIDYISPGQVNAQLPSNIATGGMLQLTLANGSAASAPVNLAVDATEPGLLAPGSFKIGGNQYVVAILPDGTYVLPAGAIAGVNSRPAKPGETVTMYGVGFGPVTPSFPAGEIVTGDNTLSASFDFLFGQAQFVPVYYGLAPSFVGLYQFDVVVPAVPDSDLVPFTFNLGGLPSIQTLYIAVHQ